MWFGEWAGLRLAVLRHVLAFPGEKRFLAEARNDNQVGCATLFESATDVAAATALCHGV